MLRKRSRAVTSKQAIVGSDQSNLPWLPPEKPIKTPISYFLSSPRVFKGFLTICSETNSTMSPTSVVDVGKPFSAIANSLWSETNKLIIPTREPPTTSLGNKHYSWDQPNNSKGIGIALVDENPETNNPSLKQHKRKLVVFGSQLRKLVVLPCFSPESPREFGIKTPRTLLREFGNQFHGENQKTNVVDGEIGKENISVSEIEESEDYTCVISHGPNPKTTHIFGNCIVEKCCGVVDRSCSFSSRRNGYLSPLGNSVLPSEDNFLSFCNHCKKHLGHGKDIYMYRGEKAFCSQECRCQEMLFDDGVES